MIISAKTFCCYLHGNLGFLAKPLMCEPSRRLHQEEDFILLTMTTTDGHHPAVDISAGSSGSTSSINPAQPFSPAGVSCPVAHHLYHRDLLLLSVLHSCLPVIPARQTPSSFHLASGGHFLCSRSSLASPVPDRQPGADLCIRSGSPPAGSPFASSCSCECFASQPACRSRPHLPFFCLCDHVAWQDYFSASCSA